MSCATVAVGMTTLNGFSPDPTLTMDIVLRWLHVIAGITWVGLLYFFTLVSIPFFRQLDPATRAATFPGLMSRALAWFRGASIATVLLGLFLWMMVAVETGSTSAGHAVLSFVIIWTLAFGLYMGVLMSPAGQSGALVGLSAAVIVVAAAWLYVVVNPHQISRLLCIGIGGGLGWFMLFNVWGVVWRVQKRMILWTRDFALHGTPIPQQAPGMARRALLATRLNFVLSFPMLFFMLSAAHFPLFQRAAYFP